MESCRLLFRRNIRIREWASYCSRLRSSSTVLCSSSARLGSARRVSGLRSGGYNVCSAAPMPWSRVRGVGLWRRRPGMRDARGVAAVGWLRWGG